MCVCNGAAMCHMQLLPIYPSPLYDDGYDVADYVDVHPDYGTLDDFKTFVTSIYFQWQKMHELIIEKILLRLMQYTSEA